MSSGCWRYAALTTGAANGSADRSWIDPVLPCRDQRGAGAGAAAGVEWRSGEWRREEEEEQEEQEERGEGRGGGGVLLSTWKASGCGEGEGR
eukprot:1905793-Rhodomonas_salina.1